MLSLFKITPKGRTRNSKDDVKYKPGPSRLVTLSSRSGLANHRRMAADIIYGYTDVNPTQKL